MDLKINQQHQQHPSTRRGGIDGIAPLSDAVPRESARLPNRVIQDSQPVATPLMRDHSRGIRSTWARAAWASPGGATTAVTRGNVENKNCPHPAPPGNATVPSDLRGVTSPHEGSRSGDGQRQASLHDAST